ncbi:MAG: GntR family transcriptional regulator [Bauldia sp.]|nr:GntR family transcriptional regulator [Bauldia sp.]
MARKPRESARSKTKGSATDSGRTDAADDVVDRICATLSSAISSGALKPGAKILDDVIAEHFGVSRTVVRGALDVLQRDHLLERKRNRGAFVAEPSVEEARQLFAARHGLESVILGLVVQHATDEGLDRLEALNEEERHLPENTGERGKVGPAPQFHVELAKLGKNEVLIEVLLKVLARVSLVNALYEVEPRDNCGDHRNIIAAIRRRDLETARKLMEEHLVDLEERVRLTPNDGDHNGFINVLQTFSA